jgi:hypothetical protein
MAQLTLTEKNSLAETPSFRGRVFQGLFSKANFFEAQTGTPANLKAQKQRNYATPFLKGGANTIDIYAVSRTWLSNYNADPPDLDVNNQPTDDAILNTASLDTVYNLLAGVNDGDELLPIV